MPDTPDVLAALLELRDRVNALISKVSGDSEKSVATPPAKIAQRMAKNLCIRCGKLPATTRGLCNADYQGVRRMIRKLKISDDEAVARWLWTTEGQKGRKSKYSIPANPSAAQAFDKTPRDKKP